MKDNLNNLKQNDNLIYIVYYTTGSYDDYQENVIFATKVKSKATKYVTKFNKILKKWKTYYSQFEEDRYGMKWIKKEHIDKYFDKWYKVRDIGRCSYYEVKLR